MLFKVLLSEEASFDLAKLESNKTYAKRLKAVRKALAFLEKDPKHPGLKTHKYHGLSQGSVNEVFEAYAENKTPGAYRIFWRYGPAKNYITILSITPHP